MRISVGQLTCYNRQGMKGFDPLGCCTNDWELQAEVDNIVAMQSG